MCASADILHTCQGWVLMVALALQRKWSGYVLVFSLAAAKCGWPCLSGCASWCGERVAVEVLALC